MDLNTSHVKVQPSTSLAFCKKVRNLNTSHVKVQQIRDYYIKCY